MLQFEKYLTLENFFLLFLILMAGGGCDFVQNLDARTNPLGAFCCFGSTFILIIKRSLSFSFKIWLIVVVFSFWAIYHISTDRIIKFMPYMYVPLYFLAAYTLVNIFKDKLFRRISQIITFLTVIDLLFWILQNIVGIRTMTALGPLTTSQGTCTSSFLFYSVSSERYSGLGLFGLMRNSGFAWEPGRYASICVIGILCNLMVNKSLSWYKNKDFYILIAGLFTSFSTTGYVALFVLFCLRYLFSLKKITTKHIIGAVCISIALPIIMSLSFMREKISYKMDSDNYLTNNQYALKQKNAGESTFTVDRFEGLELSMYDIRDKPIWGYGLNAQNSWCQRNISPNLRISNGITKVFAEFGIPIGCVLFMLMIYNSIMLRRKYNSLKNSFFIVYLVISISYNFSTVPLVMALYMNMFLRNEKRGDIKEFVSRLKIGTSYTTNNKV